MQPSTPAPPSLDPRLSPPQPDDERFMREALNEARKAYGRTTPNPLVGCVLVRDGEIIARGHHVKAGAAHAEVAALRDAQQRGVDPSGATAYVNLEPCSIHQRTPPCTDALTQANIGRVVAGIADPFPGIRGRGLKLLLDEAIDVTCGVLEDECRTLNAPFLTRHTLQRPHITAKVASSIDGRIATHTGNSFPITGPAALQRVHIFRDRMDAILVGCNTVLQDNPRLTCRLPQDLAGPGGPLDPVRIILDTHLRIPTSYTVYHLQALGRSNAPTFVFTSKDSPQTTQEELRNLGVRIFPTPLNPQGTLDLQHVVQTLAGQNIHSVLVEGGQGVLTSFLREGLVDTWVAHIAPIFIGGHDAPSPLAGPGVAKIADALRARAVTTKPLGPDVEIALSLAGDPYGLD